MLTIYLGLGCFISIFSLHLQLMLQIVQHIEPLLREHDFVIVPSLGGFVASLQPSRNENDTLYPPCKMVGFNPTLTYNDGLLAQAIAQQNRCTLHEANRIVEQEAQAMHQQLRLWKHLSLGTLGTLHQRENGIDFEPAQQGLPTSAAYGLQPVYFPTITQETTVAVPAQQVVVPVLETKKVALKRSFNFTAACVAVILLLLMIPTNFNKQQNESRAMFVPPTAFEEVLITPQSDVVEEEQCTPYHVVIGSFYTQAKALKFLKQTPSSLGKCQIIYSDGRFRITAASYPTEELGNLAMEDIAKRYPAYKDAWLLHYNP